MYMPVNGGTGTVRDASFSGWSCKEFQRARGSWEAWDQVRVTLAGRVLNLKLQLQVIRQYNEIGKEAMV